MQESNRYFLKNVDAERTSFVWAQGEILSDDPLKVIGSDDRGRSLKMGRELGAILEEAQSTLLMTSPYLVPGKAGMEWFQKVRDRGITVKIITNSLASTDSPVAEFGYIRYRKEFLRMGVKLYELKPTPPHGGEIHSGIGGSLKGALHTKTIVLDDRAVFVGSFNLDLRSAKLIPRTASSFTARNSPNRLPASLPRRPPPSIASGLLSREMISSFGLLKRKVMRCVITGNPWLGSGAAFPGGFFT